MPEQLLNLHRVMPEMILCLFGIVIMIADPFVSQAKQRALGWTAFIGALLALVSIHFMAVVGGMGYSNLISADTFSVFVHVVVVGAAAIAILGSMDYLDMEGVQSGEFYALVLFATAGMGILASANELVTAFVGLEMSSISSYILAGYRKHAPKSNEASLKYFILGSFATAFFLYGIAMVYGATGTTRIDLIQTAFQVNPLDPKAGGSILPIFGLGLIFVGLGFKVVAAPFQVYAPDVYEGAPSPVTALLASAPKVATFAIMVRIFYVAFGSATNVWFWVIWVSAVLTMVIGNLGALVQTNVKRMLAYSSIAHAGYILVAFAAGTDIGIAAVLFYLAAYSLMKIGAFLVVSHLGQQDEQRLELKDYAGLGSKQPVLAACFSLFLLSLLGLPATGGFLGKFFAFQAALDSHLVWLVVIAAINSVVGAYYYLRVIISMYFWDPSQDYQPTKVRPALATALTIAAAGTIYLGILPSHVLDWARTAADSLALR
ncbi:MAG TPA: NADH-quinone oxidoreductase subunit N [Candidatus Aquilonibacter sp.]|nr:NADH-quinone oxidoreductase subunit N [Candidatus Aquilonibacter sp.]